MQDSQSLTLAFERPLEARELADSCSSSPQYELDSSLPITELDRSSELAITAEVLSSIRRRFFPANFDNSVSVEQGLSQSNGLRTCLNPSGVTKLESLDSDDQQFQCKYGVASHDSNSVPSRQSFSSLEFSTESSSPDQNYISTSSDIQTSPDSTFSHSPFSQIPKEESFDTACTFIPAADSEYSVSSEYGVSSVDQACQLKAKAQSKPNHILPPCRVCGDRASGFHYGANTCEACKGFFRRSLKKDTIEYKCNGNQRCPIQKGRRTNCPLCRYNKCLAIGMSRTAIKTGRYTHEKRTKDIVEVKQLSGDYIPVTSQSTCRRESDNQSPTGPPVPVPLSPENEQLVRRIYAVHKVLFPFWHKVLDSGELQVNIRTYAECYSRKKTQQSVGEELGVKREPVPPMPVKLEEDIGNRSSTISLLTKHLELAITVFVKFAKAIPGFCDLTLNDQASLVKLSRFEVWMVGAHRFFDSQYSVVSGPRGNSYHLEELCDVINCDFVKAMFSFSATLQGIGLSNEETALIKCVVLTFSDRCTLQEPEKVDEIQLRLIRCLECMVNSGRKFSQIMSALVSLRDLTEWHAEISENLILEWPTIKRNPLLLEIMSV